MWERSVFGLEEHEERAPEALKIPNNCNLGDIRYFKESAFCFGGWVIVIDDAFVRAKVLYTIDRGFPILGTGSIPESKGSFPDVLTIEVSESVEEFDCCSRGFGFNGFITEG